MTAPKTFDAMPLAASPLSIEERARWIAVLDPLLRYAGSPGDWGYESKLGILTKHLYSVRAQIVSGEDAAADASGGAG
jgi:hypothetical protein